MLPTATPVPRPPAGAPAPVPVPPLGWSAPAQDYVLTTHATLRLGSLVSETATQLRVRKCLRLATPGGGGIFDLTTLGRVQTPAQGPEQLTAELAPLLAHLVLETDAAGRLVRVCNKPALRQQWAALLPALHTKYRRDPAIPPALLDQLGQVLDADDALEAVLRDSPEYGLLFPPHPAPPPAAPRPGTALLARFVGEIDLPLRTLALCEAAPLAGGTLRVQVVGEVDEARYRAADVRRAWCRLTDQPALDTRVAVLHTEDYTFGPGCALLAARRYTRADIPGVLSRQLTVLLNPDLTPDAPAALPPGR